MIDWLNDNSGAVQAISVAVLAVVTAIYAWRTWSISSATRKQAEASREAVDASREMTSEIREQRLAEHMPLLLIDLVDFNTGGLKPGDGRTVKDCYPAEISFRVHNVGAGPAIDVDMTVVHPKAHYWRNRTRGYLLKGESIDYETDVSIYRPKGLGLSDVLRECGVDVPSDCEMGLIVRYRDIHERVWLAWMLLEHETDLGGERNDELIWYLNETGQHFAQLTESGKARSDVIFSGTGLTGWGAWGRSSTVEEGEL